jgi:hypothetical protein
MYLERTVTAEKNDDRPAPAEIRRSILFFPLVRTKCRTAMAAACQKARQSGTRGPVELIDPSVSPIKTLGSHRPGAVAEASLKREYDHSASTTSTSP